MKTVHFVNKNTPQNEKSNITFCTTALQFAKEVENAQSVQLDYVLETNFDWKQVPGYLKFVFDKMALGGELVINCDDTGMLLNLASNRQVDIEALNGRLVGKKCYLTLPYLRKVLEEVGFRPVSFTYMQNCTMCIKVQK